MIEAFTAAAKNPQAGQVEKLQPLNSSHAFAQS
jgi:hypothetical protein